MSSSVRSGLEELARVRDQAGFLSGLTGIQTSQPFTLASFS
jgi:hypothetical protein